MGYCIVVASYIHLHNSGNQLVMPQFHGIGSTIVRSITTKKHMRSTSAPCADFVILSSLKSAAGSKCCFLVHWNLLVLLVWAGTWLDGMLHNELFLFYCRSFVVVAWVYGLWGDILWSHRLSSLGCAHIDCSFGLLLWVFLAVWCLSFCWYWAPVMFDLL